MVAAAKMDRMNSLSDFQDGGPSPQRRNSLQYSFRSTFRGAEKENEQNGFRQFVGLYKNYPLADDILNGATKRQVAFKESGKKCLNTHSTFPIHLIQWEVWDMP